MDLHECTPIWIVVLRITSPVQKSGPHRYRVEIWLLKYNVIMRKKANVIDNHVIRETNSGEENVLECVGEVT